MTEDAWETSFVRTIGVILSGDAIDEFNLRGERIADDTILIVFNGHYEKIPFVIPKIGEQWEIIHHTYLRSLDDSERIVKGGQKITVEQRSILVFRRNY